MRVGVLGADGEVLRVLESVTPQVLYPRADAEADFGSVPGTLTLRVHQISAAVGRGFPAVSTVIATLQET